MRRVRQQCVAQAKHRSNSAARSTPTRSAARDTPKKINKFFGTYTSKEIYINQRVPSKFELHTLGLLSLNPGKGVD
ncbi:MAG: hypothetical protein NZ455_02135 [Bacteroidia bacterium]|nr:hypothetical protein [Bacteroidia bacterium]MDW8347815.1 hypothetical protein [Bacteroidia bacterium]